jgi:hypothetical protein
MDRVHGAVDHGQSRSTVDHGQRARRCLIGTRRTGAGVLRCSPVTEEEDEPVEAVLGRCSPVTEEWQRDGAPKATKGGGLSSSRGGGGREEARKRGDEVR